MDEVVKKLKKKGIRVLGVIDMVVSNAVVNPTVDPMLQTQESTLDKQWEINVKATILLLQACRFITIIDELYNQHCHLFCLIALSIDDLFQGIEKGTLLHLEK
ncbi:hypothetical protein QQP08_017239 [Theobroma cacao]|nr:hypothetical protein QQP08_017239 [Theobroma cacao]